MVDRVSNIKKIGKKFTKPLPPALEPNKDYFENLMKQRAVKTEATNADVKDSNTLQTTNTLFDEVRNLNNKVDHASRSSPEELAALSEDVISQIDALKNKLETPNLEVKGSVQTILRNKLSHIDESLKIALDKAGLEYTPPEKPTSLNTPMERFLGLLTHSQRQLETLSSDVQTMAASSESISPANMLLVQIKVTQVQQEIEIFTSMLNKALESIKTIGNVQI